MSHSFVSRGRRGTLWHPNMFHNAPKAVLQAQYFSVVLWSWVAIFVAGAALWRPPLSFETCRVVRFLNRIVRAAWNGDNVQIPWQEWHFVRCDEVWRKPPKNIDFEIANFEVHEKTRRKTSMRKSDTKYSFWCSHVSRLESLVFLWPRRVFGGSCKTSPFRRFPSRLSCRFAWQAWRFVTFQPVW